METAGASWQLGSALCGTHSGPGGAHAHGRVRGCRAQGLGLSSLTLKTRPPCVSLLFFSLALLPAASVGRPCRRASPSRPSSVSSLRPPPSQVTLSPFWCPRGGRAGARGVAATRAAATAAALARPLALGVVVARFPAPCSPLCSLCVPPWLSLCLHALCSGMSVLTVYGRKNSGC